jgi:NAD(P)-dependent dehydrogenase (short-subunit alcohol dehydrogenase family)
MNRPYALITGAGSGIGRACVETFLKSGWSVIAVGRKREPLEHLKSLSPEYITAIPCDITSPAQVEGLRLKLTTSPTAHLLKCLVNNAGQFVSSSFEETPESTWQQMFEVNLLGSVRVTKSIIGLLKANKSSIVNVASTLGLKPVENTLAYSASKAAMINWTLGLAKELAPHVRVNCVCPGLVDTPIHSFHHQPPDIGDQARQQMAKMQPMGRIGQPHEIAAAVQFLASDLSAWTTGSVLSVDGGINIL